MQHVIVINIFNSEHPAVLPDRYRYAAAAYVAEYN